MVSGDRDEREDNPVVLFLLPTAPGHHRVGLQTVGMHTDQYAWDEDFSLTFLFTS